MNIIVISFNPGNLFEYKGLGEKELN